MDTRPPKIKRIETFVVQERLQQPFYFSQWSYDTRQVCLVRVTTEDGQYGWGEGYGPAPIVAAAVNWLSPHIMGQNPLHTASLWQTMYRRSLDYARRGVLLAGLSAIDVALWDLKGKIMEQPVHVLLGGPRREKVKVYATGMYFVDGPDQPQRLAQEAAGYIQEGFSAIKMKVGLTRDEDLANVKAVRQAIGPEATLMIDANHALSWTEARALAADLADFDIGWFEEPLSPEDYQGYSELRQNVSIPIAAGECEYLCAGFRHLLAARCVDIIQPDICAAGGLTEAQRIVSLAHTFHTPVTPHCWGTGIAFAAAVHLMATMDRIPSRLRSSLLPLEMDRTENPLRDQLTQPVFVPQAGMVDVPNAPGLGVDVDLGQLHQFTQTA